MIKKEVISLSIGFDRIKSILNKESYKDFEKFMRGQTVDAEGVFEDDFIRWVKGLPVSD